MKRLYFLIVLSASCVTHAFSQSTAPCSQTLRLVRSTYEQGRLHELPDMMKACLEGVGDKGFTPADKREAYRYLTLAYIYLEEPEEADKAMLKLLETDHFFQINNSLDPAEFIALYNKFRHEPLYFLNFKFGINVSQPSVMNYYNIGSTGAGKGKYGLGISIQLLAAFEKTITKKFVAAPEIGFVVRSFSYSNPSLAVADENPNKPISSQDFSFSQNWIDFNAIVNYKLTDTQNFKTYVGAGPGISYLLGSNNQASTTLGNDFTVTGTAIKDTESYNKLVYSFTVVAGVKIKFADFYVMGDIRYQYGLTNAVNTSTRTNPAIGFDYQGQYNDYKMNNLMINVGVSYPVFKPKKLIK
jgi:hypothetical protein